MRALFYNVVREAKDGKVLIDGEEWGIAFNTIIYENGRSKIEYFNDKNLSTLVVKNEDDFFELLEEYIAREVVADRKCLNFVDGSLDMKIKFIIMYLFANASTEEFLNPETMLRRKIDYLNDDTFSYLDEGYLVDLNNSLYSSSVFLERRSQSIMMETPWKMRISLKKWIQDELCTCPLADISYGIRVEGGEKVCYVYSMMKPKEYSGVSDNQLIYRKKINRELYKLNDGVLEQESEEYKNYRDGKSRDYQENVTDVTQSFVLSLAIFVTLLQKEGISKIKVVPYLPVRYLGRQIAASNINDVEKQQQLEERNRRIQENCTNKFMRTFRRVAYHMGDDLKMFSLPYEMDEYMTFMLSSKSNGLNNPILEEVSDEILKNSFGKVL